MFENGGRCLRIHGPILDRDLNFLKIWLKILTYVNF